MLVKLRITLKKNSIYINHKKSCRIKNKTKRKEKNKNYGPIWLIAEQILFFTE
jgi:hypothetical protein